MKLRRRMRIGEIMTDQPMNQEDDEDLDRFDEQLENDD